MTAWIITRDLIEPNEAVGVTGPREATANDIARLKAGEGIAFRLLDDDGEVYYYGRRLETSECDDAYAEYGGGGAELAPLDCFGTPNAGAVTQEEKNASGKWEAIN